MKTDQQRIGAVAGPFASMSFLPVRRPASSCFVLAMLFLLAGCTSEDDKKLAAIKTLSDQAALTQMAIQGDSTVGKAAVAKLTDQVALAEVATHAWDRFVKEAAVEKLTDQPALAKIAIDEYSDFSVRESAVKKLSDPRTLVKVIFETDDSSSVQYDAYQKLNDSKALAKLSAAAEPSVRLQVSILLKIPAICVPFPKERRWRFCEYVLEILPLITAPPVSAELGDVKDIVVRWHGRSADYSSGLAAEGEEFTISVATSKADKWLSHRWATEFPDKLEVGPSEFGKNTVFREAVFRRKDFAQEICDCLSAPTLAKIAIQGNGTVLPPAAVAKLADQPALAKVAVEAKGYEVRCAAIGKLTDKAVLDRIARQDRNKDLRVKASVRLDELPH